MTYDLWHDQELKIDIVANMRKFGGSFVQCLGDCIMAADNINLAKLEKAFPDYIERYHPKNWGRNQ